MPENTTLPDFVLRDAEHFSDKVALVEVMTGMKLTYGEVARETRRFAKALRSLGLRKGHVVVVVLPNVAIYPVVALGIMAAGGVFSGANPLALAVEIRKQVLDSSAKILVTNGLTYETKVSCLFTSLALFISLSMHVYMLSHCSHCPCMYVFLVIFLIKIYFIFHSSYVCIMINRKIRIS